MARRRHHGLPAESATAESGQRGVDNGSEAMGVAGRRRWRGASDTRGRERTAVRLRTVVVGGARGEAVDGGTFEQRRCRLAPLWRRCAARAQRVAATRREHADRRAQRGKRRVTGVSDF
jgi:hypothetical protein